MYASEVNYPLNKKELVRKAAEPIDRKLITELLLKSFYENLSVNYTIRRQQ